MAEDRKSNLGIVVKQLHLRAVISEHAAGELAVAEERLEQPNDDASSLGAAVFQERCSARKIRTRPIACSCCFSSIRSSRWYLVLRRHHQCWIQHRLPDWVSLRSRSGSTHRRGSGMPARILIHGRPIPTRPPNPLTPPGPSPLFRPLASPRRDRRPARFGRQMKGQERRATRRVRARVRAFVAPCEPTYSEVHSRGSSLRPLGPQG